MAMLTQIHQTWQARSKTGLRTFAQIGILRGYRRDDRLICADRNMAAEKAVQEANADKAARRANGEQNVGDDLPTPACCPCAGNKLAETCPDVPTVNYLQATRPFFKMGKFGGWSSSGLYDMYGVVDPNDNRLFHGQGQVDESKLWKRNNRDGTSPPIDWSTGVFQIASALSVTQMYCFCHATNYCAGKDNFSEAFTHGDRKTYSNNPGTHHHLDMSDPDFKVDAVGGPDAVDNPHPFAGPIEAVRDWVNIFHLLSSEKREAVWLGQWLFKCVRQRPALPRRWLV